MLCEFGVFILLYVFSLLVIFQFHFSMLVSLSVPYWEGFIRRSP